MQLRLSGLNVSSPAVPAPRSTTSIIFAPGHRLTLSHIVSLVPLTTALFDGLRTHPPTHPHSSYVLLLHLTISYLKRYLRLLSQECYEMVPDNSTQSSSVGPHVVLCGPSLYDTRQSTVR